MANYRKTKKHGNTTITSSAGGSSSHSYSSGSKSHRVSNRHRAGRVITRTTTRIGDWIKVTQKTSPNHKSKSTSYKSKANSKPLTKKEMQQVLDSNTISNDKYIFDELVDNLLENEDSSYNIKNLKDDDVVKKR